MKNYISQINLAPDGGFRGFGQIGLEGKAGGESADTFAGILSTTIGVMTVVAIIWFVIQFFIGAIGIVMSGGDKGKLTEARTKITSGLIGLVIVISSIFIIDLIGNVLGFESILDIPGFIEILSITSTTP